MKPKKSAAKAAKIPASRPAATTAKPKTAARKTVRSKSDSAIPSILFEGDEPAPPPVSGPGEKFTLGPIPPPQQFDSEAADLPESYGTRRLFLTARDPHWLYANWDLTREQQATYNSKSLDGHLIVRIFQTGKPGAAVSEVHVHPESRHWFAHVASAGEKYSAELGYYAKGRKWTSVAKSGATITPPETISIETAVEFATISVDVPFEKLLSLVKDAVVEHRPLALAVEELRQAGHSALPPVADRSVSRWTPAQEQALAKIVSMDQVRRVWIGSLEITELIRRQLEREMSSLSVSQFSFPTSPGGAITSVTSPFGGMPGGVKGFWFNVNAELIIYGATEPDATVTIGGRKIKLRPDGSFAYRFALPDGKYELPAVAISADETDGRAANLKFSRSTHFHGDVGAHPQDPALKLPSPDNV